MPKAKPLAKDCLGRDIEVGRIVAYAGGSYKASSRMIVGVSVKSENKTVKTIIIDDEILNFVTGKTFERPTSLSYDWYGSGKSEKMLVVDSSSFPPEYESARQFISDELAAGNVST